LNVAEDFPKIQSEKMENAVVLDSLWNIHAEVIPQHDGFKNFHGSVGFQTSVDVQVDGLSVAIFPCLFFCFCACIKQVATTGFFIWKIIPYANISINRVVVMYKEREISKLMRFIEFCSLSFV